VCGWIDMHICVNVCMYICMFVCMYVCVSVWHVGLARMPHRCQEMWTLE